MCDTPLLYAVIGMVFVVLAATGVMAYLSFKKKKPEAKDESPADS